MKNAIRVLHILEMQYAQYDNYRHEEFVQWCIHTAHTQYLPLKLLVSNDYLLNWYHDQWLNRVELPFLDQFACYSHISDRTAQRDLLDLFPQEIIGTYPSAILNKIRVTLSRKQTPLKISK